MTASRATFRRTAKVDFRHALPERDGSVVRMACREVGGVSTE